MDAMASKPTGFIRMFDNSIAMPLEFSNINKHFVRLLQAHVST